MAIEIVTNRYFYDLKSESEILNSYCKPYSSINFNLKTSIVSSVFWAIFQNEFPDFEESSTY